MKSDIASNVVKPSKRLMEVEEKAQNSRMISFQRFGLSYAINKKLALNQQKLIYFVIVSQIGTILFLKKIPHTFVNLYNLSIFLTYILTFIYDIIYLNPLIKSLTDILHFVQLLNQYYSYYITLSIPLCIVALPISIFL